MARHGPRAPPAFSPGAADLVPPLLRGQDPDGDRGRGRRLTDARVAPAEPEPGAAAAGRGWRRARQRRRDRRPRKLTAATSLAPHALGAGRVQGRRTYRGRAPGQRAAGGGSDTWIFEGSCRSGAPRWAMTSRNAAITSSRPGGRCCTRNSAPARIAARRRCSTRRTRRATGSGAAVAAGTPESALLAGDRLAELFLGHARAAADVELLRARVQLLLRAAADVDAAGGSAAAPACGTARSRCLIVRRPLRPLRLPVVADLLERMLEGGHRGAVRPFALAVGLDGAVVRLLVGALRLGRRALQGAGQVSGACRHPVPPSSGANAHVIPVGSTAAHASFR